MLILVAKLLFSAVMFVFTLMALFIVYHVVRYSKTKAGLVLTLALFLPVVAILIFSNVVLFSSLDLENIISIF